MSRERFVELMTPALTRFGQDLKSVLRNKLLKRLPFDELSYDVAIGRIGAGIIVNLEDVLVTEFGDGFGFPFEAGARFFVIR